MGPVSVRIPSQPYVKPNLQCRFLRALSPRLQLGNRAPSKGPDVCIVDGSRRCKWPCRRSARPSPILSSCTNTHYGTACLGNPLFLIKARMQAYSPALPVGAQHYYRNSFAALREIFRAEGLRGYIRGMDAAILRTCMGSSVCSGYYGLASSKNML